MNSVETTYEICALYSARLLKQLESQKAASLYGAIRWLGELDEDHCSMVARIGTSTVSNTKPEGHSSQPRSVLNQGPLSSSFDGQSISHVYQFG